MKTYPDFGLIRVFKLCALLTGAIALGVAPLSADQKMPVQVFMPAGNQGGILVPGTFYPPSDGAYGRLKRKKDRLEFEIKTDGLPAGAYTVWWVAFNKPANCIGPCDAMDVFLNAEAVGPSSFYSTGLIVEDEGEGLGSACFRDVHFLDEYRGAPIVKNFVPGPEIDPMRAEIHLVIKYHGPAIEVDLSGGMNDSAIADAYLLNDQTTTLLGNCENANGFLPPNPAFPLQCFDPQVVIFPAPNNKK